MIHATNTDDTLPAEGGSTRRAQLVDDLRLIHKSTPQLSRVDEAMIRTLQARPQEVPAKRRPSHRLRLRLGVPLVAVLAVAVGLGSYVHQQTPTPVSAQTILRHAARAGLVPSQVTRFVYQVTSSTGYTGTTQFWVQANASGTPRQIATEPGAGVARHLAAALVVCGPGPSPLTASQFTGQTTLDGVHVDVIQPFADGPTTYIDAQNFLVRGVDWTEKEGSSAGSTWKARLLQYGTVPGSNVPAAIWHRHNPAA